MAGRDMDDASVGVVIAGGFGVGWALWAASGLSGGVATSMRIAGVVLGALLVIGAVVRRGIAPAGDSGSGRRSQSMFRSRGYWMWVAVEVGTLVAGNAALRATGHSTYVPVWTAAVVGVHFLGFGRLFAARFYLLGLVFIAAAAAGGVAGAAGASSRGVEATTGLIAAASLFGVGAWTLAAPRRSGAQSVSR